MSLQSFESLKILKAAFGMKLLVFVTEFAKIWAAEKKFPHCDANVCVVMAKSKWSGSKQNFPIGNCHMAPSVMIRDEDTNGLMSQL